MVSSGSLQAHHRPNTLADITDDTVKTGKNLAEFANNPKSLECITAFLENQPLFEWLKKEFTGSPLILIVWVT